MRELILERIKWMMDNAVDENFKNGYYTVTGLDFENLSDEKLLDAYAEMSKVYDSLEY